MFALLTFAFDNDKDKFEYLYEKYKRLLYKKALEIVKDHALAEDAVAESYMRVYKNIGKIGDPNSPQAVSYLIIIAKNVAINIYNRQKRQIPVDISESNEADTFNLEEEILIKDAAARAMALVGSLKEELRSVFLLKYAYDMNTREIATQLGISENNVTVRLHRAKAKLAKITKGGGQNE